MKIFEQYTANIPLFLPSPDYLLDMKFNHIWSSAALSQVSYNEIFAGKQGAGGSTVQPRSYIKHNLPVDPNAYEDPATVKWWIERADFYDAKNMPYIIYYKSMEHLFELMDTTNLQEVSDAMKAFNKVRKQSINNCWDRILKTL